MAKFFDLEHTKWRFDGSRYACIFREFFVDGKCTSTKLFDCCLADYLFIAEFDISDSITYCLADNGHHKIKYRVSGGLVDVFLEPVK